MDEKKLQINEWIDSQKNEAGFWQSQQKEGNQEQFHRNDWYRLYVLNGFFNAAKFSESDVVVDVGSGPEGILHTIKEPKTKIAIDPLMHTFIEQGYDVEKNGVTMLGCPAETLYLRDNFADVVFSLNMLDHTQNPALCLAEIYRILKPQCAFLLVCDMRPTELLDAYHKLQITKEWLLETIKGCGFKSIRQYDIPHQTGNPTIQFVAILSK